MTTAKINAASEGIAALWAAISSLIIRAARRLKRPVLILVGSIVVLLLLIFILQSGLGVDSDVTITDSHRPEIVGGE